MTQRNDEGGVMTASTLVQLRIPADLLGRIDQAAEGTTRTAWLLAAAERQLDGSGPAEHHDKAPPVTAGLPSGAIGVLGPGTPSPGAVCMTPGCWQGDTSKYGTRQLPLCPACAHAACSLTYQAPRPALPATWQKTRAGEPA
jgi:hypothetical protein